LDRRMFCIFAYTCTDKRFYRTGKIAERRETKLCMSQSYSKE
jgi:hypothetical protein